MPLKLEPLPYKEDALEPLISAHTVGLHYHKHHAGYLKKLNEAIAGTEWSECELAEIVCRADDSDIFDNAAQTWNHSFYWKSMTPPARADVDAAPLLQVAIAKAYGDHDRFKAAFASAATGLFGSGWTWLVVSEGGDMNITTTANADNPMRYRQTPLLTLDVWEHAYYLDYKNERARYVSSFLDGLINWRFAERNFQLWLEAE